MICIYKMYFKNAPEWFYIGATTDFIGRRKCHKQRLSNNKHTVLIMSKCKIYGVDNVVFEVIEKVEFNDLSNKEKYYIDTLKPTLNTLKDSVKRHMHTQQTKETLRKINTGIKLTKEQRYRLSQAQKGKKYALGAKRSDKFKQHLSDIKSKKVIDTKTNVIFKNVQLAANSAGLKYSTLYAMLSGTNKNKTNMQFYGA